MGKPQEKPLPKLDNIAAIATAPGHGGIGVVRISGFGLQDLAFRICGSQVKPRHATYTKFLGEDKEVIDQGILLYFPAPNSYTGEEVLELQGHGGPAVLQTLLKQCLKLGARLAEPGEFTKRAFLNNKIDLTQAESVADLINATTEQAARSAVRSLQGDFSKSINQLLDELIHLRMFVEATLDFPEEDIDASDKNLWKNKLDKVSKIVSHLLDVAKQGTLLRDGAKVVLVGAPNAGKSSLLNSLSREEVAIVSDIPGTTRDAIKQSLQIRGVPIHLVDTAGIRDTSDQIELLGIDRTHQNIDNADILLILIDESHPSSIDDFLFIKNLMPKSTATLYIHNKVDKSGHEFGINEVNNETHLYISAKNGWGIDLLEEKLLELIGWHQESGVFMARERHIHALRKTKQHLDQAIERTASPELLAEELKEAQNALSSITGTFTPDDLLGEIFGKFCIGK